MLGKTLIVRPGLSRQLFGFILLNHAGAVLTLVLSPISGHFFYLLVLLALVSFFESCRQCFLSPRRVTELELLEDDTAGLGLANGERIKARIVGQVLVTGIVCIIRLRHELGCRSLILCPDSCSAQTYHLLRLRLQALASASA